MAFWFLFGARTRPTQQPPGLRPGRTRVTAPSPRPPASLSPQRANGAEGGTAILDPGKISPAQLPTNLALRYLPGPSPYSGPVRLESLNTVRLKFPSRWRTGSGSSISGPPHCTRLAACSLHRGAWRCPWQPAGRGACVAALCKQGEMWGELDPAGICPHPFPNRSRN